MILDDYLRGTKPKPPQKTLKQKMGAAYYQRNRERFRAEALARYHAKKVA